MVFEERKARRVRDLEARLASLEKILTSVAGNERLKLQLQKAATKKELLEITSRLKSPVNPPVRQS